ncbi:MAG: hypothetical protein HOI23_12100 [Deltaproteobacteria bacterium]|jgi:hypothetical protein|nr:hypothetical protein [Deltaproteobacteria bacterium]MBT6434951.1 hypothetical protein [Deltaproteobacteria bacterium]MBT6488355.1 hypothetical protein [Deltaproteobacteria bacterium]
MPSSINTIARDIRSSSSAGGNRVWLKEARTLASAATADGRITSGERDTLEKVMADGNLTRSAATHLRSAIESAGNSSPSVEIDTDVSIGSDVSISARGLPTSNGRTSNAAWGDLAEALADGVRNNDRSFLRGISAGRKKQVITKAVDMLENPKGRSAADKRQMRSNAFTVLFAMTGSLPRSRSTARLINSAHNAMMDAAQNEKNPRLAKHMTRLMTDKNYQSKLTKTQKTEVKELFEAKFPQKFDVENILDDEGYIRWDHAIQEGENMYRSYLVNVQKNRIGGSQFEIVEQGDGWAELEVKFDRSRGEDGRVKGIRLHVRTYDDDMFDKVGEGVGISYGGHSDTGNNQEKSLANALKKGRHADNPQLIFLDLCAGLDGLDDGMENLGNVELITTVDSSLYGIGKLKDENGTFKGVIESEMQPALFAIWEGLSREEGYGPIRNRVKRELDSDLHHYETNYILGTLKDYRDIRWAHMDGDDDGVTDALDIHYRFGTVNPRKSVNLTLKARNDVEKLNGDTVRDAALDVNVSTHYNALTTGYVGAAHGFTSGGFFDGGESQELVRFVEAKNTGGKYITSIQVNSGLAHASRETLGALVHYESMMHLVNSGVLPEMKEDEQKLMALVFAASRLGSDGKDYSNDSRIWKKLLGALNLPTSMPFKPLADRLAREHSDYCGNMAMVRGYKTHLSAAEKKALKDPSRGRSSSHVA